MCLSWGTAGLGRGFIRSFPSPSNPQSLCQICGCQLCCSRSVGRGWKLKMGNHLCVFLYLLHLGVTSPLLPVCSSQRGLNSCIPDLKPQPNSLQGILPAQGVFCGTAGGSAAWIPRSLPMPSPLTASIGITVRLLLPCPQRVFCVCPAARDGVCCLLFLFPRESESLVPLSLDVCSLTG